MNDSATTESLNTRYAALLAVLDNAADAIISIDVDGRILTFNPAAERMFQYRPDAIIGEDIGVLMPQSFGRQHDNYVNNYLRTGQRKIIGIGRDVQCRRRDGSTFIANLSVSESSASGQRVFTGILRDLTEQNAIRDRVASLGGILENSLSAIYVISPGDLRIAYANSAAWQAWGDPSAERDAFSAHDLFDAESCQRFVAAIDGFMRGTSKSGDFRARAIRDSGVRYSVQVHLFAGEYAGKKVAIASVLDISEQQKIAAELQQMQLEQQLILRYAPIGIALMDDKGRLVSVNDAAIRICGYRETELIGKPGVRFMHTDDQLSMRHLFKRLVTSSQSYSTSTHRLRHADGRYVPIKTYNATVCDKALGTTTLICMFEDLSEQHLRETELQIQRERLAHAARLTQMGEMAAGIAHELNQPLTAIQTYANAGRHMLDRDLPQHEDLLEACQRIAQQAQRAADVIRKIRSLTARHETRHERCDIAGVIEDLMTLVEIDLRHSSAAVRLDIGREIVVRGDKVQLEQVLLNFLRNAIDAVAGLPGERQEIVLRAVREAEQVRVEVADLGPGVADSRKQALFEPFVSDKQGGMGMGLSISKSIIEAHEGRIGVRDNRPQGAVFWFTLPADGSTTESTS